MDDNTAFTELSALLTGLHDQLLDLPADRELLPPITAMADAYFRGLRGTYPVKFPALLEAYKALVSANPKPKIDDALLANLRATQVFKDNEMVAKQVVNVWYFSQFNDEANKLVDGGFYEFGFVWPLIKAHPIGFSTQLHGYWTDKPRKEKN